MATNAQRQRAHRARKKAQGLVTVSALVPEEHAAAVAILLRALCEDRDLEPGPARNVRTGRYVRV